MSLRTLIVVGTWMLAAACSSGSAKKNAADPVGSAGDGEEKTPCEPGRCLEDISRAIGEHRPEARACYESARKAQPTLEGKLILNFAIDSEGVVGETSQGMQDNQITDQGVVDCVIEVVKKVRFVRSAQGKTTRAYHRFEFSPEAK